VGLAAGRGVGVVTAAVLLCALTILLFVLIPFVGLAFSLGSVALAALAMLASWWAASRPRRIGPRVETPNHE
jgi:uncharacterized protein (DUF58 family)